MLNITHYQRNANQNHYEVPFHASQNGCDPKVYKQSMLERVWRKGNSLTLLVGPIDCSLPGSSVHRISQARILEWVAISSSRGSSHPGIEPRSPIMQADSLPAEPPGKPRDLEKK